VKVSNLPEWAYVVHAIVDNKDEESGIKPYLQANKLSCHFFLDTGRKHKTLSQIQRNLLFAVIAVKILTFSFVSSLCLFLQVRQRGAHDT
jgi:hypothetical protein